jgi:hypothetical protein
MTITAHSSDVGMPCGHYAKIVQVIRDKIHKGKAYRPSGRPRKPYKRTRPDECRTICGGKRALVMKILADAAINDPDDRQELWSW